MVYAKDGGTPSLTGSTRVEITVQDINDNKPQFTQPQYELNFKEGFQGDIALPEV